MFVLVKGYASVHDILRGDAVSTAERGGSHVSPVTADGGQRTRSTRDFDSTLPRRRINGSVLPSTRGQGRAKTGETGTESSWARASQEVPASRIFSTHW